MITGKQLRIFEAFAKHPFAELTRNQIKKETKEKSNNALALLVNQLKKECVLVEKKIGKSGLLSLDMNNEISINYIAMASHLEKKANDVINRLKEEITDVTPFFSMAVFGSYAANEQKKDSDLDIAVFIDSEDKKKKVEAAINSARLKLLVETDIHVIPMAEMVEMLANGEENLGKQIARKHIAVHNHRIFYDIVREGMKHGFHA
ncbi:MAG: nucleotidyltransferase domain-containing protein [Candidatus Nanoarchaeia archaeon]